MANKGYIAFDTAVIGAGAAGFMAAITAARNGRSVAIIEHKDRPGKKILATGNGKCNFTNERMGTEYFRGDKKLIETSLGKFTERDTIEFLNGIGVAARNKNGYYYPNSESAASVLKALEMEAKRLGIRVYTSVEILDIKTGQTGFDILVSGFRYVCEKLIIATGLLASPKLGSDGSIFPILEKLGHSFTRINPALCGLKCHGFDFKRASGVRCQARVSVYVDGELTDSDKGELQIADYGISGIPVFQISRFAADAVASNRKCSVQIDFCPEYENAELVELLKKYRSIIADSFTFADLLNGIFNEKLAASLLKQADLSEKKPIGQIENEEITELVKVIKQTEILVDQARGFDFAQVCAGGIRTEEINIDTLESRLVKNMYFAGEILDVDGICGGYNLQWAWTSGFIAGSSVNR